MSQSRSIPWLRNLQNRFVRTFPLRSPALFQAWVITYLGALVLLFTAIFFIVYLALGLPVPATICAYGGFSVFIVAWMIFRKKWTRAATHYFCITTAVFFTASSWFSGGIDSPFVPWLATAPIIAALLLPARETLAWGISGLLLMAALLLLDPWVPSPTYYGYPEMETTIRGIAFGSFFSFSLGIIVIYDQVRRELARRERLAESEKKSATHDRAEHLMGQEMERQRVAREFHDHLGTLLTVTRLRHEALSDSEESRKHPFFQELNAVGELLNGISRRYSVHLLRDFGLEKVLQEWLRALEASPDFSVELITDGLDHPGIRAVELDLYRIAQAVGAAAQQDPGTHYLSLQVLVVVDRVRLVAEIEGLSALPNDSGRAPFAWGEIQDRANIQGADLTLEFSPQSGLTLIYEQLLRVNHG